MWLVVVAASSTPTLVYSQVSQRLIVMADDSGAREALPRGDEALRRVVEAASDQLRRSHLMVIDEDAVRQSIGFGSQPGAQKSDLIKAAILSNSSSQTSERARYLALIRVVARAEHLDFATQMYIRVNIGVIDLQTNATVASREISAFRIPAPLRCDEFCAKEAIGDKASDLGAHIAAEIKQIVR